MQIDTTSEVKEQVLKYLSVMARPMVVNKNEHPVSWTQIYADAMVSSYDSANLLVTMKF